MSNKNIFITKIRINKVRHLENVEISLSGIRRHLILTGKNGSGKTSVLEAIRDSVLQEQNKPGALTNPGVEISYSQKITDKISQGITDLSSAVFAYIPAERSKYILPDSIEKIEVVNKSAIDLNASRNFLKYMLSMDYQLYGAKNDNNVDLEATLESWFANFLTALREIYDCRELELKRDTKNFRFIVEMPNREPFALHEMSDGYAAFLDIYMELVMRFENNSSEIDYSHPAIAIIDVIEAHLHVNLQKRVLPFYTRMFPNVQFIVSTHSPFVITSLSDAVVFDLESATELVNPGIYSYEAIVEGFLDAGQYSNEMKSAFGRYRELCSKELTSLEAKELEQLVSMLETVPPASKELYIAFRTMEGKRTK